MFHADTIIDTIQSGKQRFIDSQINNQVMADVWTDFVRTQTAFCHAVVKTIDTTVKQAVEPQNAYWTNLWMGAWIKQMANQAK